MILHLKLNLSKKKCSQLSIIPFFHKKKNFILCFLRWELFMPTSFLWRKFSELAKYLITNFTFTEVVEVVLSAVGPYVFSLFVKANNDTFLTVDVKQEIRREYESYITSRRGHSPSGTVHTYDERSHLCTA